MLFNGVAFKSYCYKYFYKPPYKQRNIEQQTKEEKTIFPNNTIQMEDKTSFYSEDMTTAKFENGKVYCLSSNSIFHIGNYKIDGNFVYVGRASDDREIGRILLTNGIPSLIFLSNLGFNIWA